MPESAVAYILNATSASISDYENAARAQAGAVSVTADAGSALTLVFTGTRGTANSVTKTLTANGSPTLVALTEANLVTLGDGRVDVSATARSAGQNSTPVTTHFILDTVAPTIPVLHVASDTENAAQATNLSGAVTVNAELDASVKVSFSANGQTVDKYLTGTGAARAVTLNSVDLIMLGQGTVSVSASASDLAGNSTDATPVSFTLSTTLLSAPVLMVASASENAARALAGAVSVIADTGSTAQLSSAKLNPGMVSMMKDAYIGLRLIA